MHFDGRHAAVATMPRMVPPPMVPVSPVAPIAPIAAPPGLEMIPFQTESMPVAEVPPTAPPTLPPTLTLPLQQQQDVESWSVEKVMVWLNASGLGHLSKSFEEHRITGDILLELSSNDLEEIGVHAFGDKKRLLRGVGQLKEKQPQLVLPAQAVEQLFPCPPAPPTWEAPSFESPCPPPSFSAPM